MFSDKIFQLTVIISLIAHSIILFGAPALNLNILPVNKKEGNLQVSYVKNTAPNNKELLLKLPSKIAISRMPLSPFKENEGIFQKRNETILQGHNFTKPAFIKPDVIAVKKKITLPPIDIDKINNPSYISYYQIVREKIRRAAYQNYSRTEVGEVYLAFAILSDGSLKKIQLVEEKSSSNLYLRGVALKSIKEASPFPDFPAELDYPELSFNVVISFEVE